MFTEANVGTGGAGGAGNGGSADAPRRFGVRVTLAIGGYLRGSYLHGSAVLGGWVADRSDVDILFVVADDISPEAVAAIGRELVAQASGCPGRGLEASVVTVSQAASPAEPWPFVLHTGPAPAGQRLIKGAGRPGDPDLLMHYAVCRAAGITLLGPSPQALIGPVPRPAILGYLAGELDWGLASATECYAVLNACRAAHYLATGEIVSKLAGGRAALAAAAGPASLINRALEQQQGRQPERPPGTEAMAFVRQVSASLAQAVSPG